MYGDTAESKARRAGARGTGRDAGEGLREAGTGPGKGGAGRIGKTELIGRIVTAAEIVPPPGTGRERGDWTVRFEERSEVTTGEGMCHSLVTVCGGNETHRGADFAVDDAAERRTGRALIGEVERRAVQLAAAGRDRRKAAHGERRRRGTDMGAPAPADMAEGDAYTNAYLALAAAVAEVEKWQN